MRFFTVLTAPTTNSILSFLFFEERRRFFIMKINCDRGELLDSLLGVSRAVSAKSSIPAIEGILFKCTRYLVMLTAYDLEIGITTSIPAEVEEPGDIVINAKLLIEMVRKIESENVSIEVDSDLRVTITGNQARFTIMGIPPGDFPEIPSPEPENTLTVEGKALKNMIGKTIYAVSTSDQKPVHNGTKFVISDGELTLVSVDGYRLAICRNEGSRYAGENSFVVPAKTLNEVSKLVGDDEDEVSIGTARRYAVFRLPRYTIVTRLLEGDFLDYKKSIPAGYKTRARIYVNSLYDSVERASLIINDRFKSPIRMRFEENSVEVSCSTALGNAQDEFACELEGEAVEIGFNNRYILEALRYSGAEELYIELNGPISPIKIVPVSGDEFLFLVLPVRIKTNE
jgi:DNA polymerase-3 subunit beta